MEKPRVRVYTDYKSPYAFVANQRLFELEEKHGVELEWLPYTLRVAEFMGTVEERTPHLAQGALRLYGRAAFCQCAGAYHEGPAAHL
jgi:2-hydroxychromene-2-carboxylate isomerase